MPAPTNLPLLAILLGQAVNRVAHFADDVVAAESDLYAKCNFFQKLAVGADGRDAQVGAAEIDSDGKIRHGGEDYQIAAAVVSLLIDDC